MKKEEIEEQSSKQDNRLQNSDFYANKEDISKEDDFPINLAVSNVDIKHSNEPEILKDDQCKYEPKAEVVLETSVIRPKKLTRAMQESMERDRLNNEKTSKDVQSADDPIIIDDAKPDIIELPADKINGEIESSNQEDESDNLSLMERKSRTRQTRKTLKNEIKMCEDPIDLSIPETEPKDSMDSSQNESKKASSMQLQIKNQEETNDEKSTENTMDNKEAKEEESPIVGRRTRRSNGKSDETKETVMKEPIEVKEKNKDETENKPVIKKSEDDLLVFDTRKRRQKKSNDEVDQEKVHENSPVKKEIEVLGTRSVRKGRKTRASEEITKPEAIEVEGEKMSSIIDNRCGTDSNKEHSNNDSDAPKPEKLEEQCTTNLKEEQDKKIGIISRGRQMGRRSRPQRKPDNILGNQSEKSGSDDETSTTMSLAKTKKVDIKLKKVDIRTKEGHAVSATVGKKDANISNPENIPCSKETNSNKEDIKQSPPTSRRSRRSKDPAQDIEISDQSTNQPESLVSKVSEENKRLDERRTITRRGRKRNLSSNESNSVDTPIEAQQQCKKAKQSEHFDENHIKEDADDAKNEPTNVSKENDSQVKENFSNESHMENENEENIKSTSMQLASEKQDENELSSKHPEIIDVTDDEDTPRLDERDDISVLEVEDSNDVHSDSINELLDSNEASNIESNDTSPVRKKRRGRPPGSSNKAKKAKIQDENQDLSKQVSKALAKRKKFTQVEVLLERFKGPFIHIEGSFRSPNFVNVINSSNDTLGPKTRHQRGICDQELRPKLANFGHSSALSKQYDSRNIDQTWVCVFCQKTSHFCGLGDLFGPYWVASEKVKTPQKVRKDSQHSDSSKKSGRKRRKSEISEVSVDVGPVEDNGKTEIWFHEDCFIWIPNTFLIGGRIIGLEEGIEQCQDLFCSQCHNRGASVGCTAHGCKETAHVHCATKAKWHLDMHNFDAKCVKHAS